MCLYPPKFSKILEIHSKVMCLDPPKHYKTLQSSGNSAKSNMLASPFWYSSVSFVYTTSACGFAQCVFLLNFTLCGCPFGGLVSNVSDDEPVPTLRPGRFLTTYGKDPSPPRLTYYIGQLWTTTQDPPRRTDLQGHGMLGGVMVVRGS